MATALEMVQEQFPHLAYLINDPEIGPLLLQAVDQQTGFDGATFDAKIQQTAWFRNRTREQRELEIQRATDPTTYWAKADEYADTLREVAWSLGINLSPDQSMWLTAAGQNQGIAPDSASMRELLRPLINLGQAGVMGGIGSAGAIKNEIEATIRGQWFAPIADPNWLANKAIDVAYGYDSIESINAQLASQAYHMFPHLRDEITQGQTLADIFNPYRSIIADELEYGSVEEVDMNDPEWRKMLDWRDPNTNELRTPTASEVQLMARDRTEWWQTQKGRQLDAAGAKSMLNIFGARA